MERESALERRLRFYQDAADAGSLISADYNQTVLAEFYAEIEHEPIHRICDLGCGMGKNLPLLCRRFRGARFVAFDLSSTAIRAVSSMGLGISVAQGNVTALAVRERHFDLIVCTEVLEHVNDLTKALAEIARAVRKGGFCIISSPNYLNPVGLRKWYEDRRKGSEFWDPWGGHEGYETLMLPRLVDKASLRFFDILKVQGAGYLMAWIPLSYSRIGRRHDRNPMIGLGRLRFLRNVGMNRYLLLRKK